MANHQQQGTSKSFVCSACKNKLCDKCVDYSRALLLGAGFSIGANRICTCKRKDHISASSGE